MIESNALKHQINDINEYILKQTKNDKKTKFFAQTSSNENIELLECVKKNVNIFGIIVPAFPTYICKTSYYNKSFLLYKGTDICGLFVKENFDDMTFFAVDMKFLMILLRYRLNNYGQMNLMGMNISVKSVNGKMYEIEHESTIFKTTSGKEFAFKQGDCIIDIESDGFYVGEDGLVDAKKFSYDGLIKLETFLMLECCINNFVRMTCQILEDGKKKTVNLKLKGKQLNDMCIVRIHDMKPYVIDDFEFQELSEKMLENRRNMKVNNYLNDDLRIAQLGFLPSQCEDDRLIILTKEKGMNVFIKNRPIIYLKSINDEIISSIKIAKNFIETQKSTLTFKMGYIENGEEIELTKVFNK